jgi:hypothetical protein
MSDVVTKVLVPIRFMIVIAAISLIPIFTMCPPSLNSKERQGALSKKAVIRVW